MSTLTVTDIRRTGETASRSTRGIAASWLNLNGTGTIAVRDSQNVSSVTDNGTGDFTKNFTSLMASSSFAATSSGKYDDGNVNGQVPATGIRRISTGMQTGSVRLCSTDLGGAPFDVIILCSECNGGLA